MFVVPALSVALTIVLGAGSLTPWLPRMSIWLAPAAELQASTRATIGAVKQAARGAWESMAVRSSGWWAGAVALRTAGLGHTG